MQNDVWWKQGCILLHYNSVSQTPVMKYLQQSQNVRGILVCIQQHTICSCVCFYLCSPRSKRTKEQKMEELVSSHIRGLGSARAELCRAPQGLSSWMNCERTDKPASPLSKQAIILTSVLANILTATYNFAHLHNVPLIVTIKHMLLLLIENITHIANSLVYI